MNQGLIPAKWARLTPARQAIYDAPNDRRVTWRELDELVRRMANGLLSLGLTKGDKIAMLSRNCVEFQALYFAAGRVGLVTQPLNWRLATPALVQVVKDAAPKVLITQGEFAEVAMAVEREVDLVASLSFGPGSPGTFDDLVARSSDLEPEQSNHVGEDGPFFLLY